MDIDWCDVWDIQDCLWDYFPVCDNHQKIRIFFFQSLSEFTSFFWFLRIQLFGSDYKFGIQSSKFRIFQFFPALFDDILAHSHPSASRLVALGDDAYDFESLIVCQAFEKRHTYRRRGKKHHSIMVRIIVFVRACRTMQDSISCIKYSRSESVSFQYGDAVFAAMRLVGAYPSF